MDRDKPVAFWADMDNEFYKHVLYSMENPFFIIDTDFRLLFLNRASEQLLGLTLEECVGRPCSICGTPLCGTDDCCIRRYLRGEAPAIQRRPDGRAFQVSISDLLGPGGDRIAFLSLSTEVTELARTQERLAASDERYRLALQQTGTMMWEYDLSSRRLRQFSEGKALENSPFDRRAVIDDVEATLLREGVIHPDSIPAFQRLMRQGGDLSAVDTALQIRGLDGDWHWVSIHANRVQDAEGKPMRIVGTTRDITREKLLEQRSAQEQQYRAAMFSSAVCTYEANLTQDKVMQISSSWADQLGLLPGCSYSQLVGTAVNLLVHPDHREEMFGKFNRQALLDAFADGQREVRLDYLRLGPEEKMIWVHCTATLIQAPPGNDVCCFIHMQDIDRQMRQELALRSKAERDPLTGLYNRSTARRLVEQALRGTATLCAAFMMDIDNFKNINDTFGHQFGDEVLVNFASRLSSMLRKGDILARLGGDEFFVFLYGIPHRELAFKKADQICRTLHGVYPIRGVRCELSCSVGIAFAPEDGADFKTLYQHSDAALYQAKALGKNRWHLYEEKDEAAGKQTGSPPSAE